MENFLESKKILTKDSISEKEKFRQQTFFNRKAESDFHELILLDDNKFDKHLKILNDTKNPHCLNLTQERVLAQSKRHNINFLSLEGSSVSLMGLI